MSGLEDLFGEAEGRAAREVGGEQLDGDRLDTVRTTVRRAHSRRAALRTGAVAVAAVVLGGGLFFGISHFGGGSAADEPSASSSPSATPSPTPSPSASEPDWPAFAGTVTVDPHLPDASPITPEVWASVEPGWVLVSYQESWTDAGGSDVRGPDVIYLVSPAGDRYELTVVQGDPVGVLAWNVGSTTAAVSVRPDGDAASRGVIDLVTGKVTPRDGFGPYIWSLAFLDAQGEPVYHGNDTTFDLLGVNADGSISHFVIPAEQGAAELAKAKTGLVECGVAAPYDESSVLVQCADGDGTPVVVQVWPDEGRVEYLYDTSVVGDPITNPSRAGDQVVAGVGSVGDDACPTAYVQMAAGATTPSFVPGSSAGGHLDGTMPIPFGALGDELVWGTTGGCAGTEWGMALFSSDLAGGRYAVLIPYPTDRPQGEQPYGSVTGVAVGR